MAGALLDATVEEGSHWVCACIQPLLLHLQLHYFPERPASEVTLDVGSDANWYLRNWSAGSIKARFCLGLIPGVQIPSKPPFNITLDAGLNGNHAGSAPLEGRI